ncbi:protein MpIBR5 [Marchantia polymorpha subsp. ruderalis]|uniref:Tyrosine-protein phosphatase domain-containing protein n=2 Tax=Marchantia polymorpha TaxID=3197 RepID=A0AAF6AQR6_MARPO|nr:hypothetical protein MARPO_0033s0037 [Marchantia polymorpha]BBM98786.1 hypothetical protein Mp_1g16230 [Marchantia polymorpha subsp. ruderalis]|eukprot:PTQ41617.1 hypothetical protein MARPO_0033s0037 [Marchantia polymorpha]
MRKRERENPCYVCGHYHKYEDGEVCGICGHRQQEATEKGPQQSAFSTEILPAFLYLGSYDNASRAELLKAQGITRILNTVPACQNLYKNSFSYYSLKEDKTLPLDECVEYVEQSRRDKARVLVHCMSGQNRSPAVVIAYLMRHKRWRLPESYQWVKERRPSINLTSAIAQQLQEYEVEVFGNSATQAPMLSTPTGVAFGFGYPSANSDSPPVPIFSHNPPSSTAVAAAVPAQFLFGSGSGPLGSNFVFGAVRPDQSIGGSSIIMDQTMDSS